MTSTPDTIDQLVARAAAERPARRALVDSEGTATSFAEFHEQIMAIAGWVSVHTAAGDRIAVVADNSTDYARLYYAVPAAGRTLVLVNQRLSADERAAQISASGARVAVGDDTYLAPLAGRSGGLHTVPFTGAEWQGAQAHSPASTAAHDAPAWMLYTSGSTGAPKPVLHTHRSILAAVRGSVAGRSVRSGGVYLLPFPMCHVAGYNMLVHHAARSTVLPVAQFRPDAFVAAVNAHGVTSCSLAPTMLHSLLAYLDETECDLPTLREIAYGSAAIPAALLRRALDRLDVDFHQGYGLTETGGNVTFLGPAEHRAGARGDPSILATSGRPHADVDVRIADRSGEILIRGAQVAPGLADADGWLHTGDVGRIDDEGRLVVVDRLKDVIITGGENVSSREVEDALSAHPGVDIVAVVGVPDDHWGEAICAVVVPRGAPSAEELVDHVRARLAAFKRPRHVLFVDALPTTGNGKISKPAVRVLARAAVDP